MITAIVTFKVPTEMTSEKALDLFKSRAPIFQAMPGLISKQFLFDADRICKRVQRTNLKQQPKQQTLKRKNQPTPDRHAISCRAEAQAAHSAS